MGAVTMQDWHAEAVRLRDEGLSERGIAVALNKSRSTVHAALAAHNAPPVNGPHTAQSASDAIREGYAASDIPGQQTIDGGEIGEVRVDGTVQLGLIDFGGKAPQSATLSLTGAKADLTEGTGYRKGERVFFAGEAQVYAVTGRDTLDKTTMIPTTAEQHHAAKVFELHVGDEEQILVGLFRQLVRADRQGAAAIADVFVREANGGA